MKKIVRYILASFVLSAIVACQEPDNGGMSNGAGPTPPPVQKEYELDEIELLDFSYAGYKHGEKTPEETHAGYAVYDITDYKTGRTDREAFIALLTEALGSPKVDPNNAISFPSNPDANVVVYFPEGRYILHNSADDITADMTPSGASRSQAILIQAGNIVLKGDGPDKTFLVMDAPMQPADPSKMYSSPEMIQFKHNSGLSDISGATVSADAAKGAFSVNVSSAAGLNAGDWVCLYVKNNDSDFVSKEVHPYTPGDDWNIVRDGVEVIDYHQIASVWGNKVTFKEPIMHEIEADRGWEIKKYPHYENVGVEDLTFVGKAKNDFVHHGSWEDDGGYKPLNMNRLTNSWCRRVNFESTSEALNIVNCANVSAYCITMKGNRGHSSIRSQASSRVLIAGTKDETSGGRGNFHAVGVSKHSIGTVLLRNVWGDDSCFESHANQPRATLIDHCKGALVTGHQGGNANEAPHHLADLVLWNFEATKVEGNGTFIWWDPSVTWWRILPPVIVGFQSPSPVVFTEEDVRCVSNGNKVEPESLYEKQLKDRDIVSPTWLNQVKTYN